MTTFEHISSLIEKASHDFNNRYEAVQLHNERCDRIYDYDNVIYAMEDFEDVTTGIGKYELVRMVCYGEFNPNHDFFRFNAYGNLESTSFPADWIDPEEIAQYCVSENEDLGNDDIRELLNEGVNA